MKRSFTFLAFLGLASVASAQQAALPAPDVRSVYNSPVWQNAISGLYGVNTENTPRVENPDIVAIQAVAPLIGDPNSMPVAAEQLNVYRTTNERGTYSAVIDQIIGAIYFQLGSMASNEAERTRYNRLAETNLKKAIESFPNFLKAHKNLANLLFKDGRSEEARKHFVTALKLGDVDPITYGILSAIYYEASQWSAAETAARNSLMLDPTVIEFRRILGLALFQQERFSEARAVFEEILQERPNEAFYWQMISNTYINEDQIDSAANLLEIVRFMGRADAQTLLLLGDVYMNKNMVEDAAETYYEALSIVANMSGARPDVRTFLRPVETLNSYQAYESALGLLDRVDEVYPEIDPRVANDFLALRAQINMTSGNIDEAAANLNEILSVDPMNGRALLSLAEYYGYSRVAPAGLANAQQMQFDAESLQLALDLYDRAKELINMGTEEGRRFARQAYVGAGQLLARKRRLDEALTNLREAQRIRQEQRIADYIQMIESVR